MSCPSEAEVFEFEREESDRPKDHYWFTRTDSFAAEVQVVREDGANNLHSHTGTDGLWMVRDGKARFYTEDDEVVAELESDQGVLIPREYPYWFESIGDVPLEILHISSYVEGKERERVDHEQNWREEDE